MHLTDDVEEDPRIWNEEDILAQLTDHACPDEDFACGHNHCLFIRLAVGRIRDLMNKNDELQARVDMYVGRTSKVPLYPGVDRMVPISG